MDIGLILSIALPVVGVALGFLVARRTGPTVSRNRELEGEIEVLRKQSERAWAENQALKDGLQEAREQAESYKDQVVSHFYGTSEQLRELTLQYRAVFDHLADGARTLCPDEFTALSPGLEPPALSGDLSQESAADVSIEVDEAEAPDEPATPAPAESEPVLGAAAEPVEPPSQPEEAGIERS